MENKLIQAVAAAIRRYSMFDNGHRVGVAVSGGPDSVCLLYVLREIAPLWGLKLHVLHLDHKLRGNESAADAGFVRSLAARFGLPFHLAEADIARTAQESGENLEQAARQARHEFFLGLIQSGVVQRVATGHTQSDQAETVLFRFLRGAGTAGLAGIRPITKDGIVRPLLAVTRAEIETYLQDQGIAWRQDASNEDRSFARNRIRHDLLPGLAAEWNPALPETLAHTALLAQEDEEYWKREIDRLAAERLRIEPPAVFLNGGRLMDLPPAAARRLVRKAIEQAKGSLRQIDFRHVNAIMELSASQEGHGRLQAPGLDVLRSFDWLRFAPAGAASYAGPGFRIPIEAPGRYPIPGSKSILCLEVFERKKNLPTEEFASDCGYNGKRQGSELDRDTIPASLELRNWMPGDQYQCMGRASEEKLKSLFQQARVPLWERRTWPIITSGDKIVWTRRFGPASSVAATPLSRKILQILEIDGGS